MMEAKEVFPMNIRYPNLLSPLKVGNMVLKNRMTSLFGGIFVLNKKFPFCSKRNNHETINGDLI